MTREEAIKEITKLIQYGGLVGITCHEALDMAIKALEQEPKWIPVSERLPEEGQRVLFCDIYDDIMVGFHFNDRPRTHFAQDGTCEDMKNVRAWMPLPEPYKAESEE